MKWFKIFMLWFGLWVVMGCATPDVTGMTSYENQDLGFRISYPSDWEPVDLSDFFIISFLSPQQDDKDLFQDNVNVQVQHFKKEGVTLDEFSEATVRDIERNVKEYKVFALDDAVLAGAPAKRLVYSGLQDGASYKWLQYYAVIGNKAYLVTYTAEPEHFDVFLQDAEDMAKKLEVLVAVEST